LTAIERLYAGPSNWIELQNSSPETVFSDENFNTLDEILYWDGYTDSAIVSSYTTAVSLSSAVGKIQLERFSSLNSNYALDISNSLFRDVR
jgi:hypothetical protein